MLPRENRLKLPVTWDRRYPDQQLRSNLFKLITKKVNNTEVRVGFIITTKVGKATVRNRLKRKLSALLKPEVGSLPVGLELVFILYPTIATSTDEEVSTQLNQVLSKITR